MKVFNIWFFLSVAFASATILIIKGLAPFGLLVALIIIALFA